MGDKPDISQEDKNLFRQSVGKVNRLSDDRANPDRPQPTPPARRINAAEDQEPHDSLSDGYDPGDIGTGDELAFSRPGIQHGVLRKLRRGQFGIEKELDLHGLTVDEARAALAGFIHSCKTQGIRYARIIHGKGYSSHQQRPILKGKVNSWLRQKDEVLAFCSARPVDGGTGAVYVLLKLQQK